MARRLVVLRMAVVLLLAVAVVLSNVASTAMASSSLPTSGGGGEQEAPSPPSPSEGGDDDDSKEQQEQEMDKEKQKQKEKERQVAAQKAAQEEKAAQQELLKYAQAKHLVASTKGSGSYKGIAREFLDGHNQLRARYGVAPVKWDRKLARQARRWSNTRRKDCQLKHSGDKGQSVFRSHDDWNATATDAIQEWSKEEAVYDKQREKCLGGRTYMECGHFALMVTKRTAKVGCARAECYQGGVFITCNYAAAADTGTKDKKKSSSK
ncbi:hypothetical protein BDA96_09G274200 [Sorghum bicolor]|uniref:SCP domain-containing protein n=1 Tax=Sorghum bicolor TaxID=4558 RepID=A0A921QD87_SORBI|nr:hypothetical protein BDA96_09G274200 [Sorghum bicolor]